MLCARWVSLDQGLCALCQLKLLNEAVVAAVVMFFGSRPVCFVLTLATKGGY